MTESPQIERTFSYRLQTDFDKKSRRNMAPAVASADLRRAVEGQLAAEAKETAPLGHTYGLALRIVLQGLSAKAATEVARIVFKDRMQKYSSPASLEKVYESTSKLDRFLSEPPAKTKAGDERSSGED